MDWQMPVVGLGVAAAAVYIARRAWRTWAHKGSGCGGGCASACKSEAKVVADAPRLIPADQLAVRRRTPSEPRP